MSNFYIFTHHHTLQSETDSAADFNKSFCRTIKRTFFKPPQDSPEQEDDVTSSQHHMTSPRYDMCDSGVNVSASALELFKAQVGVV